MGRAEVSLFPSYPPALRSVRLQGRKRRRSRDRRPKRIPELDLAGNSALEYLSASSMVHLRPILAMLRSFGLLCFYVGGLVGAASF